MTGQGFATISWKAQWLIVVCCMYAVQAEIGKFSKGVPFLLLTSFLLFGRVYVFLLRLSEVNFWHSQDP